VSDTEDDGNGAAAVIGSVISQSHNDWELIVYQSERTIQASSIKYSDSRIKFFPTFNNLGKNFYDGVANQCKDPSVIIHMESGERFFNSDSLSQISQLYTAAHPYMIVTAVSLNGVNYTSNKTVFQDFYRYNYFNDSYSK
jgi:hypothetical protein